MINFLLVYFLVIFLAYSLSVKDFSRIYVYLNFSCSPWHIIIVFRGCPNGFCFVGRLLNFQFSRSLVKSRKLICHVAAFENAFVAFRRISPEVAF